MRYWAFAANPLTYRIEYAIRELDFDYWTTKGSDVRKGDRAAIWKTLGKSEHRGIIFLAEVVENPGEQNDSSNPYWIDPFNAQHSGAVAVKAKHHRLHFQPENNAFRTVNRYSWASAIVEISEMTNEPPSTNSV